jgi:nucleoid-associated protein YgaU
VANVGHHTVVGQETLATLADSWFGDPDLAGLIGLANQIPSGDDVILGQVLIVPRLNRRARVAGDTLESLCVAEYGDFDVATRVAVAAAANHLVEPNSLHSNQVVYFPS